MPKVLSQTRSSANNAINADSKKRRSFVSALFAAGYGKRYVFKGVARP